LFCPLFCLQGHWDHRPHQRYSTLSSWMNHSLDGKDFDGIGDSSQYLHRTGNLDVTINIQIFSLL
jgi:hypothetical protein